MQNLPIEVIVVYALPEQQPLIRLQVPAGATVGQAVERSGLLQQFPEISAGPLSCAIYSRPVALDQQVMAGDRIEILRPLLVDPKENRRRAAARVRNRTSKSQLT